MGIFLLVLAITVLSIFAIERSEAQRSTAQLSSRTTAIASALERRANASSAYLRAGAALLASLDQVQPDEFRRFVSELRLDADYRGAEGVGWAMVVRPNQQAEFDAIMARDMAIPAQLYPRPSGEQAYAVPVTYLQPDTERNRRALGFDMFSEPVRRAAMLEAERNARPVVSGKVVLAQEGEDQRSGFLIYMPVFEAAPGGRRLRGFIFSPFNAADFLASALAIEDGGEYGVNFYDRSVSEENLMASTLATPADRATHHGVTVAIANSPFVLEVSRSPADVLSGLSMATLIFGLLVASLLMLLVRMLTRQAIEDEASLVWFEEQASIRNSLTRELNHRVKNTLANVLSIIALTRRQAVSVDEFANGLDGRIRALSATHDLLTRSDWGSTPVAEVVGAELRPYAHESDRAVEIGGPQIELAPNDALSLGLAVHELATNAAKYGALSQPGGKVSVLWSLAAPELVRVEWIESGGPPVPAERGRGFGTDLIERIVSHELRNPVQLEFDPKGVRCVLMIPVRLPTEFSMRAARAQGRVTLAEPDA
ncbi:MAG TPA: CHASE domain-containing protein [Paracoccaceae bacterium]|nr:CHASE domain-containing protein [Paracoccaceae bacterium]